MHLLLRVICDADLFTNVVAKWPEAVYDAKILHESLLFQTSKSNNKPFYGFISGDSGYMLINWLMTPILNPQNVKK